MKSGRRNFNATTARHLQQFKDLASRLEPEVLYEDGELDEPEARKKEAQLLKEWRTLEKACGRKYTTDEIWKLVFDDEDSNALENGFDKALEDLLTHWCGTQWDLHWTGEEYGLRIVIHATPNMSRKDFLGGNR